MQFVLILACLVDSGAGPLDAFHANHSAINVRVEFSHRSGFIDRDAVGSGGIWAPGDNGLVEDRSMRVTGRWECDGQAEHTICGPTPDAEEMLKSTVKPGSHRSQGKPPLEMLTDGETTAFRVVGEKDYAIQASQGEDPGLVDFGPFHYFLNKFPVVLKTNFAKSIPMRAEVQRNGHPCEVEVYRIDKDASWAQLEVSYDPSVGYVPRFARLISYDPTQSTKGKAAVLEMYLADARACASGGFIPLEWTTVSFDVDSFKEYYPDYSYATKLKPSSQKVFCWHYRTTLFDDKSRISRVVLDEIDGAAAIMGVGGFVPLKGAHKNLGLDEIKRLLGRKFTEKKSIVLPNIDEAELNETFDQPRWPFWLTTGAAAVAVILLIVFLRRRKASIFLLLATALPTQGCGLGSRPIVHLTAAFTATRIIYDASQPTVPLKLVLRNEGNVAVDIFDINAGCTCREVDRSMLPRKLRPGENFALDVRVQNSGSFNEDQYTFTLATDRGSVGVPAKIYALPDHRFNPSSVVVNTLIEKAKGSFDLTHRMIFRANKPRETTELIMPPGLSATKMKMNSGKVAGAPEFVFEDMAYRVVIVDESLGLHRQEVTLKEVGANVLSTVPVVWDRVEYVSSAPRRLVLGRAPQRVFLRCSDPSVELTQIHAAPNGVRAVLSSTRELTVMLANDAPPVIEGIIEVGTTAVDRPPLRIATFRYSAQKTFETQDGQ